MKKSTLRMLVVFIAILVLMATIACASSSQATTSPAVNVPVLKIVHPLSGSTVTGPKVKVEADFSYWKTTPVAGATVTPGEGHLHFFIDVPASSVAIGQPIPSGDPKYVHAGTAPLTSRELKLSPGQHTITVVAGNSAHIALASLAPQSVTFTVQ